MSDETEEPHDCPGCGLTFEVTYIAAETTEDPHAHALAHSVNFCPRCGQDID